MDDPLVSDEAGRLEALRRYEMLDTPAEQEFDELALLASTICEAPIALINLIDAERLWVKAHVGLSVTEMQRVDAFCHETIMHPGLLVVPDLRRDGRFAANPTVVGEPGFRFYAGAPLLEAEGYALGTICVLDCVPRDLTARQRDALAALARQVITQMERRRTLTLLHRSVEERGVAHAPALGEEVRRAGDTRLRALIERSSDLISVVDAHGVYLYVSPSHLAVLGYRPETLISQSALSGLHPDDVPAVADALERVVREGGRSYPSCGRASATPMADGAGWRSWAPMPWQTRWSGGSSSTAGTSPSA